MRVLRALWPYRKRVTWATLGVLSLTYVWALHTLLEPPVKKPTRAPARVSVRMAPAPAPALPPTPVAEPRKPREQLPLKVAELPNSTPPKKKAEPLPVVKAPEPAPAAAVTDQAPLGEVVAMPSMGLTQPRLSSGPSMQPATAGLPANAPLVPVLAEDLPPAPSDVPPFKSELESVEKPGGTVTVVAVLLNDEGVAIDSLLVVPSQWPIVDLTLVFSQKGKQWSDLEPPLLPGEYRWLELRIDSGLTQTRNQVLP